MSGLNLGFRIEEQYIGTNGEEQYTDSFIVRENGQRLATVEEVAMWPLVQAGNALAAAAGTNHGCPGGVMVLHPGGRSEMRKYECAVCDALAAFRADKEGNDG